MSTKWKYTENQFITSTRNNYKKGLELNNFHRDALIQKAEENVIWVPRRDLYLPASEVFIDKYTIWQSAGGKQEGDTLNLMQLLKKSVETLDDIDLGVQLIYKKTTPRYKEIFPNGRKPLTSGKTDERIGAFKTLSVNIGSDGALAEIKAIVDSTYSQLMGARSAQNQAKGGKTTGSSDVQTAMEACMVLQYRTTGWVMDNFYETRVTVCKSIINLELLQSKEQGRFTGTLAPDENEAVLIHTFLPTDRLRIKSNGNAAINFYLSNVPNGTTGTPVITGANTEKEIYITAFNAPDLGTYRYLTAVNLSNTEPTQYVVEMI